MLSRSREQLIVFAGLLAVNAALGWFLHRQWKDYRYRTQWIYGGVTEEKAGISTVTAARNDEAQDFAEIVNRNLFRPERNDASATETASMPELPFLYGTMDLGAGSFALMGPGNQPPGVSKRVFPGGEIGGFKLVSIAGSQVIVEWGEKKVSMDLSESARRVPRIVEKTAMANPPSTITASATSSSKVTSVAPASGGANTVKRGSVGYNAPRGASADAPPGTVIDGKRKVVQKLFGMEKVYWEDVQSPNETQGNPNPK